MLVKNINSQHILLMSAEVFVIQEGDKQCILGKCIAQITMHDVCTIFVYTKTVSAGYVYTHCEKSVCPAKYRIQSTFITYLTNHTFRR